MFALLSFVRNQYSHTSSLSKRFVSLRDVVYTDDLGAVNASQKRVLQIEAEMGNFLVSTYMS